MRLIADIGGTNARFMLIPPGGKPEQRWDAKVADHERFDDALTAYLARCKNPALSEVCIDVAGPVSNGAARLTNAAWSLSEDALRAVTGAQRVRLFNDLEAFAYAVPQFEKSSRPLEPDDRRTGRQGAPRLVIAPGTGLGAALFVPPAAGAGSGMVIGTESGHPRMALAKGALYEQLCRVVPADDHTPETFVSGPGLTRIDKALNGTARKGEDIARAALEGDAGAVAVMRAFLDMLARLAGAVVLFSGAIGGVYVAGGIVRGILPLLDAARFRSLFNDHPPMADMLDKVPLAIVTEPDPALLGLSLYEFT